MNRTEYSISIKFILLAVFLTLYGCGLDAHYSYESDSVEDAKERGLLVAEVKSFSIKSVNDSIVLPVTDIKGWLEKRAKRLDDEVLAVSEETLNVVFIPSFIDSIPSSYSFTDYFIFHAGDQYAAMIGDKFEFTIDKPSRIPQEMYIDIFEFRKRNSLASKELIGTVTIYFQ